MNKHLWPLKVLWVSARNVLWLKPRTRRARAFAQRRLRDEGFHPRTVRFTLGLGEAPQLALIVVLGSDADLIALQASPLLNQLPQDVRAQLAKDGYPPIAVPHIACEFHSHDTIVREGGYYLYFK